jgi:hypothetical protein
LGTRLFAFVIDECAMMSGDDTDDDDIDDIVRVR